MMRLKQPVPIKQAAFFQSFFKKLKNNLARQEGHMKTRGTLNDLNYYQAKDGSHRANGRDLTFADGKKLFLGSSGTGAPYELTPGAK